MSGFPALVAVLALALGLVAAVQAAGLALGGREEVTVVPHLGGGLPDEHAVSRYHARWYAVTLLFLVFDMEMIFMYPWALVVADVGTKAVVEMFSLLAVLLVGVAYAWREGALRWS